MTAPVFEAPMSAANRESAAHQGYRAAFPYELGEENFKRYITTASRLAKRVRNRYGSGVESRDPYIRAYSRMYGAVVRLNPCAYCGGEGGTLDHIIPLARGGKHVYWNMTSACDICNSRKGDS